MSDNMLKREFQTRDVQRMRNIITKQHGDKTGVQVGYSKEYVERKEGDEWVYVLTNPAIPNMVKIGYTKLDPLVRATKISRGTGVPLGFEVEWAYKCYKGERIEREVHMYFSKERVSKQREFFRVSLNDAKEIIEKIGSKYI